MNQCISRLLLLVLFFVAPSLPAATFEVKQDSDGVTVNMDGKLLTRYVIKSGSKPILWPLIGPGGHEITRQYPMKAAGEGERADHPHHRSFWFTHGDVNGVSFWHENDGGGHQIHKQFVNVSGGDTAVIQTKNDWVGPGKEGKKICEDERTLTFGKDGDNVYIDFDITIKAGDNEVTFGDTKEGSFGVRTAGTMKVDAKQGGKIVNSEGQTDAGAWGKPAAWCDYHGPVKGKTVGIAILNHPQSFRYPTYWHVRTYGLFAANPFGLGDFIKAKRGECAHTLKPGQSMTFNYRVLIHAGDEQQGDVAGAFERYSQVKKGG